MRVAITGAAGRVGRRVLDLVVGRGDSVVAIDQVGIHVDSPAVEPRQLDTRDYDALREAVEGVDALIHLAAIAGPGKVPDHVVHNTNVVSSYNALRAAADAGIERVVQASSINAIGGRFSRDPRYDYFPVDERHPSYAEDPYSLSKWECERQADAMVLRYPGMSVASLRLHGVVPDREAARIWLDTPERIAEKQLWGWVDRHATAAAFVLGLDAPFEGHEAIYIVAPTTMEETPSLDLAAMHYPDVPIVGDMSAHRGFFDCSKAAAVLGWRHDDWGDDHVSKAEVRSVGSDGGRGIR